MTPLIDESTEFGTRAARHLRSDVVVWLTTVTPAGRPLPNPVWFVWDEHESVLVFSLASAARVRDIETNPRISLNFAGDGKGGDIIVLSGRATADPDAPPASASDAFVAKYAAGFERLRMTPESFSARYSVPIEIKLEKLRGH